MPNRYLALAAERTRTNWPPYRQPEEFEYDFREWVSPYTKGAHAIGGIAVVLQDWSSTEALAGGPSKEIQEYGRTLKLGTNQKLETLLDRIFGLSISEVYGTNVFPFIKYGNLSAHIPVRDVERAALQFIKKELEIANPTMILGLGRKAQAGLERIEIDCYKLPHPAARIGSVDRHEEIWRKELGIR